jgi:hypothetical protein
MRRLLSVLSLMSAALLAPASLVQAAAVSAMDLESFFSLPTDTLLGLGNGSPVEGSGLSRTFTAAAGDTLSFNYNFLTNEEISSGLDVINDFAFVSITPGVVTVAADTFTPLVASTTVFPLESGYQTWSNVLTAGGTYTLQIGVVDVVDGDRDSALLLDNLLVGGSLLSNGGFEDGSFASFTTIGDASIVGAGFGVAPPEGASQALLTTVPEPSTCVLLAIGLFGLAWRGLRASRS